MEILALIGIISLLGFMGGKHCEHHKSSGKDIGNLDREWWDNGSANPDWWN